MPEPLDRRAFLRRFGAAGLAAPALPLVGCGEREPPVAAREPLPEGPPVTRPILLPWPGGAVRILAPARELPMAYVSRRLARIWIDQDFRDRVYWLLEAHISTSTGVWRIPLPGDPERVFVQPDDPEREFAEYGMLDWDPGLEPAEGDFRVLRGRRSRVRIDFACAPVTDAETWVSAGPFDIGRCHGTDEEGCREDFMRVGTGVRHADRACPGDGSEVDLITWACLEGAE